MSDTIDLERRQIVAHMRCAIARGYTQKGSGECDHGKFYLEDCIACYDEYLESELSAILTGAHLPTPNESFGTSGEQS